MCTYCMIADHAFRWNPPFPSPYIHHIIPQPYLPPPVQQWPLEQLKEFEDLLRRVKELEDKLGCPCEPDKADYLKMFRERIEALEASADNQER